MRTRAAAAGFALVLVLAGAREGAADMAAIRQRGTLRVLAHFDPLRPEFFSSNPEAPGFDNELLAAFARTEKLTLEVVEAAGGSDVRIAALLAGKGDVVAGRLVVVPERRDQIAFTTDVFPVRFAIITRRPTPVISSVEDLRRYRVGSVRTSRALVDLLNAAGVPAAQVDDGFQEPSEFLRGLQSGRVQAVIWGVESALPAQKEDPAIQIGAFVGAPAVCAYGLRKDDVELLHALDAYLDNVKKSPTWSRLVVKYFGDKALDVLRSARTPAP